MINAIKNILGVAVGAAIIALFLFVREQYEKAEKQRAAEYAAEYAAERAWRDQIVRNCENAVRSMSDASTLKFGDVFGVRRENIEITDSGYLYYVTASDASTGDTPITVLCYTNRQGTVLRVVPRR